MADITVSYFHPVAGSPGEVLWEEGHASHMGANSITTMPPLQPHVHAWVGFVDTAPASIQAVSFSPALKRVHGLLSYTRPQYRGLGVYKAMQIAYEEALLGAGYEEIWSNIVAGSGADVMRLVLEKRGGVLAQYVYRRPLVKG